MTVFAQTQYLLRMELGGVVGYIHVFWHEGEWKARTFKSAPTIAGGLKAQDWEKMKDKVTQVEGLVEKVEAAIKLLENKLQPRRDLHRLSDLGLVPARQITPPKNKKTAA